MFFLIILLEPKNIYIFRILNEIHEGTRPHQIISSHHHNLVDSNTKLFWGDREAMIILTMDSGAISLEYEANKILVFK